MWHVLHKWEELKWRELQLLNSQGASLISEFFLTIPLKEFLKLDLIVTTFIEAFDAQIHSFWLEFSLVFFCRVVFWPPEGAQF